MTVMTTNRANFIADIAQRHANGETAEAIAATISFLSASDITDMCDLYAGGGVEPFTTPAVQATFAAINARNDLVRRYAAGDSIRTIAADLDRSYGCTRQALVDAKVELRPRGGARRRKLATARATR